MVNREAKTQLSPDESDERALLGESLVLEWRNNLGLPEHSTVTLLRRGPSSLVVHARNSPPADCLVTVRDGHSIYSATVHECRSLGDRSHFELRYTAGGRRRQERMAAGGQAEISWDSGGRFRTRFTAEVLNVSQDGLQLLSSESVPVGVYVQVAGAMTERVGKSRYCRPTHDGYLIGVEFIRTPGI